MSLTIDSRQKGVTQTIDLAIDAEVQTVYLQVNTETEWQVVLELAERQGRTVRDPEKWSRRPKTDATIAGVTLMFDGPTVPPEHFDEDGVYVGPTLVHDEHGDPIPS